MSINIRIKLFNKIYKEFHDSIECKNKFKKIFKYDIIKNYYDDITDNINKLIEQDLTIFDDTQILKSLKNSKNFDESNKEVIFQFIKNLYYATIEDKVKAEEVRAILSIDIHENLLSLFTDKNSDLMKLALEIQQEIMPMIEQLDIKDLDIKNINVQELVSNAIKTGKIDIKGNTPEETKKIQELVKLIKEKVQDKLKTKKINLFRK